MKYDTKTKRSELELMYPNRFVSFDAERICLQQTNYEFAESYLIACVIDYFTSLTSSSSSSTSSSSTNNDTTTNTNESDMGRNEAKSTYKWYVDDCIDI